MKYDDAAPWRNRPNPLLHLSLSHPPFERCLDSLFAEVLFSFILRRLQKAEMPSTIYFPLPSIESQPVIACVFNCAGLSTFVKVLSVPLLGFWLEGWGFIVIDHGRFFSETNHLSLPRSSYFTVSEVEIERGANFFPNGPDRFTHPVIKGRHFRK